MVVGSASPERAAGQHLALLRTVRNLGALVTEVPFIHGAFDSVFAKDNAIYLRRDDRTHVLLGSPRYDVRQVEQQARARDLHLAGAVVHTSTLRFEGGDVCMLPGSRGAILGHGFRSSVHAGDALEEFFGLPVTTLELVDPGLYHLDTALTVLGDGTALVCVEAFTLASRRALEALPLRDLITVSRAEAMRFALNVVEVGDTVVTGTQSSEVEAILHGIGKRVVVTPLDEFQRAGGSAACLLGRVHDAAAQATVMQAATAAMRSTAA